jgi:hypothetical protein
MTDEATVFQAMAAGMAARIRKICEEFGPRPPGSPGEARCQEYLAGELRAAGLDPVLETFPVAQKAFMAVPMLSSLLTVVSLPFFWFSPWAGVLLSAAALAIFVLEVGLYRHVLTPFFPKSVSTNLHAVVPPSGPVRRRIILCGHADAAYEWRFQHDSNRIFPLIVPMIIVGVLAVLVFHLLNVLFLGGAAWAGMAQLAAGLMALPGVFFTRFSVVAPGAADNLSGALLTVALAEHYARPENRLADTEIVALVTGSEEAGLCGAMAFAARHKAAWGDVETVALALDTFNDKDWLRIYHRDMNGIVPNDPAFCRFLQETGRTLGLNLPLAVVTVGSSDAAAFSRAGIPAALLAAMDPRPAHYYHNRRDTWENLDPACLELGCRMVAAAVARFGAGHLAR